MRLQFRTVDTGGIRRKTDDYLDYSPARDIARDKREERQSGVSPTTVSYYLPLYFPRLSISAIAAITKHNLILIDLLDDT